MYLAVRLSRVAGLTAVAALLGGCGVLAQMAEDWREDRAGWLSGKVLLVGSAGALPTQEHRANDCRTKEPAASAQQPYAFVAYTWHRRLHLRTVPVPDGMSVAAGDLVRVNVKRCDGALKPRHHG